MRKLEYMLDMLESSRLEVVLVPLNPNQRNWDEFGCKRVVVERNCFWYRTLCGHHASKRGVRRGRFDTIVRRQHTLRALERMIAGDLKGRYAERIMEILPRIKL